VGMSADKGGPAFPRSGDFNAQTGMTMRDYFAAKAMAAALMTVKPVAGNTFDGVVNECASVAYKVADAMLKARQA
jgi:hypothetical protein